MNTCKTFIATCVYGNYFDKDTWFGYKTGETHMIRITDTKDILFPYLLQVGNVARVYSTVDDIKRIWDF